MIWAPLRALVNLLVLNTARYENSAEGPLLQSFRQLAGFSEALAGLNQLDDSAILKLLRENDFTRAGGPAPSPRDLRRPPIRR